MLDIDEHEVGEERFLNNYILDTFDNAKRSRLGPQPAPIKFDLTDPSVHQLNLTVTSTKP